jgi:hypothetical protein
MLKRFRPNDLLNRTENMRDIYWPLTRRGFFSEILVFALVLHYGSLKGANVSLLSSEDSFLPPGMLDEFISYPFVLSVSRWNCADVFGSTLWGRVIQFINYNLRRRSIAPAHLFRKLWLEDILCLRDQWNKEHLSTFSRILNDLIVIPCESHDIIKRLAFSDSLKHGYVCMHIRRGDKLISEAKEVSMERYLAAIPSAFRSLPLVVISDDHSAYLQLAEFARSILPHSMLYTTASKEASGYSNSEHYRSTSSKRRSALHQLLADFWLARESSFFVGTYSSNVGRAIYISRGGAGVDSVDGDFRFIW